MTNEKGACSRMGAEINRASASEEHVEPLIVLQIDEPNGEGAAINHYYPRMEDYTTMCCYSVCSCYLDGLRDGTRIGVRAGYDLGYVNGYSDALLGIPAPVKYQPLID